MPENQEQELVVAGKEAPIPRPETKEITSDKEASLEVESVIEKLERNVKQTGDKQDDVGATVAQPKSDQPAVTLPITQDDVEEGEKLGMDSSFRWLVEWVKMMLRKFPGRAKYRKPSEDKKE